MSTRLSDQGLQHVSGAVPRPDGEGCWVFSTIRNEVLRLPYFLEYYRGLGCSRFFIVSNQSRDGSFEFLRDQEGVVLFQASGRYSESNYGVDWINSLLHEFGAGRWCLIVDADELLVYPHCEEIRLNQLTAYMETRGANTLPTFLLDMYSEFPLREAHYRAGAPFLSACPYFDATGYLKEPFAGAPLPIPARGGPRQRLFWDGHTREKPAPYLCKLPLVYWSLGMSYTASTHALSGATAGDLTGALLHFKLLSDFPRRVEEEVARKEHFNQASQYAAYGEILAQDPGLSAFYPDSVRYRDSRQLVQLGLMHSSVEFDRLASSSRAADTAGSAA